MKLISKINRSYLKYGFFMFLIADIIIISIISHFEKIDTDHELKNGAIEVSKIIKLHGHFPNIPPTYSIKKIDPSVKIDAIFKDTIMLDPENGMMDEFREYQFSKSINGANYLISHRHFSDSFLQIFIEVTPVISIVLCFIFIVMLFYTRIISKKLWNIFDQNLSTLKNFSLSSSAKLELSNTGIDEFDDLNEVLTKMSDRLKLDYQASQEFSANAAHEFQTPLAIIRNKCESLFSDPDLDKDTIQSLREIYTSTNRLSGITKALLLLAKIDHGLFQNKEIISFNKIIGDWLLSFEEIFQDKDIDVVTNEHSQLKYNMDERLTNLLIQNLLTNAIKNCPSKNKIHIDINKYSFSISNYGDSAINQPERLFERFYKENQLNNSTGIGLAIVKKIIDYSNFTIEYTFNNFKHTFTVNLNDC